MFNYETNEIKKIIETRAKFQKVMLLFDDSVSEIELLDVYNSIKEICVFNRMDTNSFDIKEINNGYRAIIYMCSAKSFLKLNFDKREFVNLCVVKGKEILPFCVDNNSVKLQNDLYLFTRGVYDVNLIPSLSFNSFYNYLKDIVNLKENKSFNNVFEKQACLNILDSLKNLSEQFFFLDLDIISKTNIELKHLSILHLILLNGFVVILNEIKNKSLTLVDVYKVCREDYVLLNKFYKMVNNDVFYEILNFNYNYLINLCVKTKKEIFTMFCDFNLTEKEVENIFLELKSYAKHDCGIVGYLYLHDFFKV